MKSWSITNRNKLTSATWETLYLREVLALPNRSLKAYLSLLNSQTTRPTKFRPLKSTPMRTSLSLIKLREASIKAFCRRSPLVVVLEFQIKTCKYLRTFLSKLSTSPTTQATKTACSTSTLSRLSCKQPSSLSANNSLTSSMLVIKPSSWTDSNATSKEWSKSSETRSLPPRF